MSIGFIGTGALASAIVTGLGSTQGDREPIWLSPRNADIAAELAGRYPEVRVAADNQAVLDRCDMVLLAVRPQVAREVLSPLRFRRDHHVITLIGILSRAEVADLVAPAERVVKALPMPMIAHAIGATLVCPPDPVTRGFFARLGRVIEVGEMARFDALSAATATFATYFQYLETIQTWLEDHDVAAADARDYLVALFQALAAAPVVAPEAGFLDLAGEYATRGGINEQVVRGLTQAGVFEQVAGELEQVHRRITAKGDRHEDG